MSSLTYLASCTRIDIVFDLGKLSRYTHNLSEIYQHVLKKVLRYLKGTSETKIHFVKFTSILERYNDANWISDSKDTKSTSGYLFTHSSKVVSWKSTKQKIITRSTMEAELVVLDVVDKLVE